jgi:hypothetical protein
VISRPLSSWLEGFMLSHVLKTAKKCYVMEYWISMKKLVYLFSWTSPSAYIPSCSLAIGSFCSSVVCSLWYNNNIDRFWL